MPPRQPLAIFNIAHSVDDVIILCSSCQF